MNTLPSRQAFLFAIGITSAACSDATAPRHLPASSSANAANACYSVTGTITETFQGADWVNGIFYFGGPMTGDLVGTSLSGLTASTNPAGDPPGPVGFGGGTSTLTVTGGTVQPLQGSTLVFALHQVARTTFPVVNYNQHMSLVSGARRGSLNLHGTFDFNTYTSTATYHGSICP